jgi:hypothetical protein
MYIFNDENIIENFICAAIYDAVAQADAQGTRLLPADWTTIIEAEILKYDAILELNDAFEQIIIFRTES